MKRLPAIFLILVICSASRAQQVSGVIQYVPAPGQFINTASGSPQAAASLTGEDGGLLSLGACGGYIILEMTEAVENDPDNPYGVDFTVFGNPSGQWSEPGIVSVMKDENENGIPDETWYELAGSDHFMSSSIRDYQITYTNPFAAVDIPWGDNQGASGALKQNSFQTQPYYPDPAVFEGIGESSCTFTGTKIDPVLDLSVPGNAISLPRFFGYADNLPRIDLNDPLPDDPYSPGGQNSGGDPMDISWAVDDEGKYVELDMIHFIRINTGVNASGGVLGELSTEISLIADVAPLSGYPAAEKVIAVKGLPPKITPGAYELEASVFFKGRYQPGETVSWSQLSAYSKIDSEIMLLAAALDEIEVTCALDSDPSVFVSFTTQVLEAASANPADNLISQETGIYPNPASDRVMVRSTHGSVAELYAPGGKLIKSFPVSGLHSLDVSTYPAGLYFIRYSHGGFYTYEKLMIIR